MTSNRVFVGALLVALAAQLAAQPFLYKFFVSREANRFSLVFACEACKLLIVAIAAATSGTVRTELRKLAPVESLLVAGAPALVYSIQNVCSQIAYARLSPTLYQVLNQTKVVWSVTFSFVVFGQRQTLSQCVALAVLVCAAVVGTNVGGGEDGSETADALWGIVPGLFAALLSGFASTLTQWTLQGLDRNTFVFGAELAVFTIACLCCGQWASNRTLRFEFSEWSFFTLIPVTTNAVGGLLVGLVTKHAGNVAKGYAIVAGILATGFAESILLASGISWRLWAALTLITTSSILRLYN